MERMLSGVRLVVRSTPPTMVQSVRRRTCPAHSTPASARTLLATDWRSLRTPRTELSLAYTLPTGQSFRWCESAPGEYVGVIGQRVVQLRQEEDDVSWRVIGRGPEATNEAEDEEVLSDYFNLNVGLTNLSNGWAERDERFALVYQHIRGARMLRQDPVECVFEFICSSNNHISRITSMVEYLCRAHGTPLPLAPGVVAPEGALQRTYYAFPTIKQLQACTVQELSDKKFGYRARYIVDTASILHERPEGGRQWLLSLRAMPLEETLDALTSLSGVGPKVAACIALFSCDKHAAVPVDTHVWKLASKYYLPSVKGKTLTAKLHPIIMQAFVDVFGDYAGWAHNALFISELAAYKHLLDADTSLRRSGTPASPKRGIKRERDGDGLPVKVEVKC